MFDIGWSELLLIGIVALIVVGPRELPGMFRKMGQITGKARAMARDFQRAMDSAADEAGVKDIQRDFRKMTSAKSLGVDEVETSIRSGLTAEDFTKDWQGNPIERGPAKDSTAKSATADSSTAAKPASKPATGGGASGKAASKPAPKAAAKKAQAAGTSTKPAAKAASGTAARPAGKAAEKSSAKSAPKASAKAGGKRA